MNIEQLLNQQYYFQKQRGLNEINDPLTSFNRTEDEFIELRDAVWIGDNRQAVVELADMFIMCSAIGVALARELGIGHDDIQQAVVDKMRQNNEKYALEHFRADEHPLISMQRAKRIWNEREDSR